MEIAHNYTVKIETTTERDTNTSKSGKTAVQPTHSLYFIPSVYMGTDGACSKAEHHNSEGKWEALTSFDKNKQILREGKVQGGESVNLNCKTLKSTMPAFNNRG